MTVGVAGIVEPRDFAIAYPEGGVEQTIHRESIYVKLRVAHAPGMPGTFSPPPTSKETTS